MGDADGELCALKCTDIVFDTVISISMIASIY
jgi:hypothetical protein